MKKTYKDFSAIMPILGTNKELELIKKTIPAMINLNPNEIIFGIDAPEDQTLISILDQICAEQKYDKHRYVVTTHDKNWNMSLSHIIWNCVDKCKCNKILILNADSLVLHTIMNGYDIVGTSNIIAHSAPTKHYAKTIREKIKTHCHRLIFNRINDVWSGVFWIYRPYFLKCINLENYKKIYNGTDTFIFDCIEKDKNYKYICDKKFNNQSLDYENNDLYWRQFAEGIFWYAHMDTIKKNCGLIKYIIIFLRKFPNIGMRLYSWVFIRPYFFKGYQWASKHNEHKIVHLAKKKSRAEWDYYGNTLINDVYDWKNIGKTGTGFIE